VRTPMSPTGFRTKNKAGRAFRRKPGGTRAAAGFSLLEILVAMALTALVLVHTALWCRRHLDFIGKSEGVTMAAMLAQNRAAEISADADVREGVFQSDPAELFPGLTCRADVRKEPAGLVSIRIAVFSLDAGAPCIEWETRRFFGGR
jgi:prepilin-type N-terminal cleavage/methylation domain-containing protein